MSIIVISTRFELSIRHPCKCIHISKPGSAGIGKKKTGQKKN